MEGEDTGDHSEAVANFCNITGALPHVAEHYLSACGFDVNRAIEFFLENPPDAEPPAAGAATRSLGLQHAAFDGDVDPGYVVEEPDELMAVHGAAVRRHGSGPGQQAPQPRGTFDAPINLGDDDDAELQRVLAESSLAAEAAGPSHGAGLRSSAGAGNARSRPISVDLDDDDGDLPGADEELAVLGRHREAGMRAAREAQARVDEMVQHMLGSIPGGPTARGGVPPTMFPGLADVLPFASGRPRAGQAAAPLHPHLGRGAAAALPQRGAPSGPGRDWDDDYEDDDIPPAHGPGAAAARAHQHPGGMDDEDLELPEGFSRHDLEEARMMEAALLGIPYQGRMPDFSARGPGGGGTGASLDPEAVGQRELRWDQDREYEESLKADRAKADATRRAQEEAEEAERVQRQAEEEEAQRQAAEEARLASLLSSKAARLPPEPQGSDPDVVVVMVRMPDGSRLSRRFSKADPLQALFDFLDLQMAAAAGASGCADAPQGAAAYKPGTYRLVTQFPRRVFTNDAQESLSEAGVAEGGGAAFFLEPVAAA